MVNFDHKLNSVQLIMKRTSRKEIDRDKMRGLILDTAMKLFLKEGYERVTLRAIAREMDYSPGIIYWYFKNKNDILFALHAVGFEKLDAKQRELQATKDPWQRLLARGEIYLSFAMKNPEFYDLMFIMRGPAKMMKEKKNWTSGLTSYAMLKKDVRECIEAGNLIKTNAETATFAFWSFLHGMASIIIRERGVMYSKARLNAIVKGAVVFMMESIRRPAK
jgi:AcrR family transcriptional regulator